MKETGFITKSWFTSTLGTLNYHFTEQNSKKGDNKYMEILRSFFKIAGGCLGNCIQALMWMLRADLDSVYMKLHI